MDNTSSPLLSNQVNSPESNTPSSFDDVIEQIGSFGPGQLVQAVLVSAVRAFDAQQAFISIFTDAQPTWHCTHRDDWTCTSATSPCRLPTDAWAWDWPAHASVVSEWDLTCTTSFMEGLPASSFYMGSLVGMLLLASLADTSLGRKNMLIMSCLIMSSTGALTALASNIWVYSILRFVSGFGRATIGSSVLVLSTETVGKQWRGRVGNFGYFFYTMGFLSLPAIAYCLGRRSSWRALYLWTSVPAICYCMAIYFLVHESPRWLFLHRRKDEAIRILAKIASSNSNELMSSSFLLESIDDDDAQNIDVYLALKMLWMKRWAFRRLLAIMVVGFGIGMVYFGMPLGIGNLSFNLYLSVMFNALAELPSALITFLLIGRLQRRSSILTFSIMSGACSCLCVLLGGAGERKGLQMGAEVLSFFSACTAFDILLIYALELFPTCVRNSAVCMLSQATMLGGAISPMLVTAGRKDGILSYEVFGLGIAGCSLFVTCLPETKGGTFYDTMEEQENKELQNSNHENNYA